jgi:hypothetical protein
VIDPLALGYPVLRIGTDQAKRLAGNAVGIGLRHGAEPRFDVANRKSDRGSVNERNPALFSTASNVRFVRDAPAGIFATIAIRSIVSRALQRAKSSNRRA